MIEQNKISEYKIQELKELDILQVAQNYLPNLKKQGANYVCLSPFTQEKTPSFTIVPAKNIFKCFSSGKGGDVIELVKEINNTDFFNSCKILAELSSIDLEIDTNANNNFNLNQQKPIVKKSILSNQKIKNVQTYQKPNKIQQRPNKSVLDYFLSRGISEDTVKSFKIAESEHYFNQIGSTATSIEFNYYRDNKLINIKHRAVDKKAFGLEKNCELILYNLDNVESNTDHIFITEGEIDALTIAEAYQSEKNILSVPNGAGTGKKQNLSYLDTAVKDDVFKGKTLYLFFDNDQAGKLLTDAFINRFGASSCMIPVYPDDCKDINEVWVKYDLDGFNEVINTLKYPKISGITDVSNFSHKILDYYKNGYPKGDRIGLQGFDNLLSFRGGELTMVTGISGSGKSEFLDFIMVELAKNHKWRFGICSMENPPDLHFIKLSEKYLNTNLLDIFNQETGEIYYNKVNEEQLNKAFEFNYNHFNYIEYATDQNDRSKNRSLLDVDYIINQAKQLVKMYGMKGLVIDPWNTLDHELKKNETETNYVSRVLSKIIAFAEDYNVHVFLVAHPTKGVTVNGVDRVATLNDISGSGNFFNKTHNGISVFREKDENKNPGNLIEVHVQKVKFKFIGNLGSVKLKYDKRTGNYTYTSDDYPYNQ